VNVAMVEAFKTTYQKVGILRPRLCKRSEKSKETSFFP